MEIFYKIIHLFDHVFDQFNHKKFALYCVCIFLSSIASYASLLFLNKDGLKFVPTKLRKFLFVNAEKSDSGALQIGGIVFSLISMISITILFHWFPYLINNHQAKILGLAYLSWVGIFIYGYIDDCYEIRPIVKLTMQLGVVFLFCLRVSNVIFPENSAEAFVVLIILATAIVNGANLLDGLDTLTYKVSTVIYLAFIILAAPVNNVPAFFVAVTCFFNMSGFYFFNREPSKIHMGEIGVGSLGFSYVVLAVLIFDSYKSVNPLPFAISKAALPCVLPMVELGVSFLRRLMNNKSPFRGDKLHIHHVLHLNLKFSASNSSSIIACVYLVFVLFALILMEPFSSITSFVFLTVITTLWYFLLGKKHWFGQEFKLNLNFFEKFLIKKEVKVIPSNALSDFRIIINSSKKNEDNQDTEKK